MSNNVGKLRRPTSVERNFFFMRHVGSRSLTGELSLFNARPVADGWPHMWVLGKQSAIGQPTSPTQPFFFPG